MEIASIPLAVTGGISCQSPSPPASHLVEEPVEGQLVWIRTFAWGVFMFVFADRLAFSSGRQNLQRDLSGRAQHSKEGRRLREEVPDA